MPAPIPAEIRYTILKEWQAASAKVPYGEAYERWVEIASERNKIPAETIKLIIAKECEAFNFSMRDRSEREGQQVAMLAGLNLAKAYAVLVETMNASRRRPVFSSGKPVIDPLTGEQLVIEEPMVTERLKAAELVIKVHTSLAPVKVEEAVKIIDVQATEEKLTVTQLKEQVGHIADAINKLERNWSSSPKIAAPKSRTTGRRSLPGPVLLDDGVYEDEGRTGS